MLYAFLLVFSIAVLAVAGVILVAVLGLGQPFAFPIAAIGSAAVVALFKYWPFDEKSR